MSTKKATTRKAAPPSSVSAAATPESTSLPTIQHRQINGLELLSAYPSQASRHQVPLLFVHGAFAGAWMWADHFLPWFAAQGFQAHAVSLRGHGESSGKDTLHRFGISDYVDDLETIIQELGMRPVLIGHSMGGYVVQRYIEQHAVPATVLLCSVPPQGLFAAQFHLVLRRPDLFFEINRLLSGHDVDLQIVKDALFAQDVEMAIVEKFYRTMQLESQRAIWDMTLFHLRSWNSLPTPPTLVLGAEDDLLVPAFLVQSTARTFGLSAKIFRHMGHGVTHEPNWQEVTSYIADWLCSQGL